MTLNNKGYRQSRGFMKIFVRKFGYFRDNF